MSWTKEDRPNRLGIRQQICWDCRHSITCNWAKNSEPIPGWDAEVDELKDPYRHTPIETYKIFDCPEFEIDEVRK